MSAFTPSNPQPAGSFVGSFVSVNGSPLSQHLAKVNTFVTELDTLPINVMPQLLDEAKDYAQQVVPVRTGYLRSTIDWEQIARYIFNFFARARYARHVEEGTFRMPARAYMAPALARLKAKAPQVIINEVRKIFR